VEITDDQGRSRNLVYLGTFSEGMPNVAIIPDAILRPAEAKLDAERKWREREVEMTKLAVLQAARAQGRFKRALRAFGFRGRR